jgi:hypothetical protein
VFLDKVDGRQESGSLQAVPIQIVRRYVRRGDERDPAFEQPFQQSTKNHGIGNIGNVKLVETYHARVSGQAVGDQRKWIRSPTERFKLTVGVLHERVEMNPEFAFERKRVVKIVYQQSLSAPHSAPDVQPFDWRSIPFENDAAYTAKDVSGSPGISRQRFVQILRAVDERGLGGIRKKLTAGDGIDVSLPRSQRARIRFSSFHFGGEFDLETDAGSR